ncbi:hypothetical protein SZ00_06041 (plasmid) [Rhodococcus sp. AD45]|nr:hypothetical protein SZ00_06041 [Rhodococcus sp. AD45]
MSGYKSVPAFIHELVEGCSSDTFRIGKARTYSLGELASGKLGHLGVSWSNDAGLHIDEFIVPPAGNGKWSKYNVDGWTKVLRNLPKVQKTIGGWQSPNFGDWSRGSHTHFSTREVYQREIWYGQQLAIQIQAQEPEDEQITIGLYVDRFFDRTNMDERDLHLACSLLRENIDSHVTVIPAAESLTDWLERQRVTWEILPIGEEGPQSFARLVSKLRVAPESPQAQRMLERYDKVLSLDPIEEIVGLGEFARYFGFKFREDLVALESLDYGNALYLMYKDWKTLSQRSRIDLLTDTSADYDRVIHKDGWEARLATLLRSKGHNPPP